jgi:hypothetical protein
MATQAPRTWEEIQSANRAYMAAMTPARRLKFERDAIGGVFWIMASNWCKARGIAKFELTKDVKTRLVDTISAAFEAAAGAH